jgi:hypothetical protein
LLGLLLGLAGLYIVQNYYQTKYHYWAIVLLVLSLCTKQSFVFAPLSAVIFLFITQRGKSLVFAGGLAIGIAFFVWIMDTLTNGQFHHHILLSFKSPFSLNTSLQWLTNFVRSYPVFIALAAYAFYRAVKNKSIDVYGIYFLFSIIPMIGVGKTNAYANYYLEICVTLSIVSGCIWHEIITHRKRAVAVGVLLCACLQMNNLTAIAIEDSTILISRKPGWSHTPDPNDYATGKRLVETIQTIRGRGFSEGDTASLILAGKEVEYHFFLPVYGSRWNPAHFLTDVAQGRYTFFISKTYYTCTDVNHFSHYFSCKEKIGSYYLYTYKTA